MDDPLIYWGRCRSGRRWFWTAREVRLKNEHHGWCDTEAEAFEQARAAIARIAAGRPAQEHMWHHTAARKLKEINAAKRAARPAKGEESRGGLVERLYYIFRIEDERGYLVDKVASYPITKKTAKRVYYLRGERWGVGAEQVPDVGFVDRQKLEADGEVWARTRWGSQEHLYAECPETGDERRARERAALIEEAALALPELKTAMAAAHPDRGGTDAEFIAARKTYLHARTRARQGRKKENH